MKIELIFFQGCPHADDARANVRKALERAHIQMPVEEWDRDDAGTPEYARAYPSPTVLVNGRDVTGEGPAAGGASCRASGAPSVERIQSALAAS